MHSAALYHFYWRWRTQKRSIEHTELTFNEVRCYKVPSSFAKLVPITPISLWFMVDLTIVHGVYKPTFTSLGGTILQHHIFRGHLEPIEPPGTWQVRALLFRRPAKLLEMLLGVEVVEVAMIWWPKGVPPWFVG